MRAADTGQESVVADTRRSTAAVPETETDVAGAKAVKVTVTAAGKTTKAQGLASISFCHTKISANNNAKAYHVMT